MNWFDWVKIENEKEYKNGICEHKDKVVTSLKITCRSCGYSEIWNGKNYRFSFENTK